MKHAKYIMEKLILCKLRLTNNICSIVVFLGIIELMEIFIIL
jgi:hypothetical protein